MYLVSSVKTPWRSIILPNFYMKKLRLWKVNGSLEQMEWLGSWGLQGGGAGPVGEVSGRFWFDAIKSFVLELPLET